MKPKISQQSFLFLYIAVFITMVGFGMVFPLLPFYAQTFGATATQIGFLAAAFSIGQFFAAPIIGRISDRFGRKPILAASLIGASLAFFIFANAKSLTWLFFSRALNGIASAGVFPIAVAYVGDIASKEERIKYISRLTAILSLGFIVGPAISGFLAIKSYAVPFYVGALVSLISALFIILLLPESITEKAEKLIIREGLVNIKAIAANIKGKFGALFFILFSWSFAISNFQVAIPLFSEERFSFTAFQIGLVFTVTGAVAVLIQWFFLSKAVKIFNETVTVAGGVLIMALGQFLISLSSSVALLFIFASISTVGGALLRPTVNAILSRETKEGQGTTMGLAFSFESLGRIAGPLSAAFLIASLGARSQLVLSSLILFFGFLFFLKYIKDGKKI